MEKRGAEERTGRFSLRVTRMDRIIYEYIRFGHVMRRIVDMQNKGC